MVEAGMTVLEATRRWVDGFNAIPQSVVDKLMGLDCESVREITPPSRNDRVGIFAGEYSGEKGQIEAYDEESEMYVVNLDGGDQVRVEESDFDVLRHENLPMWGTMWTFDDGCDNWWLEERKGLQAMADCGFRIYESEDFGYIFGIDGAGYDFYEAHWVPLYRARGLRWHDPATEKEVC